jgi:hypothetical protein
MMIWNRLIEGMVSEPVDGGRLKVRMRLAGGHPAGTAVASPGTRHSSSAQIRK